MSADVLRRAAAKLSKHAVAADPGPWAIKTYGIPTGERTWELHSPSSVGTTIVAESHADAADDEEVALVQASFDLMAAMHPPLALALAAHLDDLADSLDQDGGVVQDSATDGAITIARAILREPS
jgi:hypothetical protein